MMEGSCHCGSVHWSYDGIPNSATTCNCSICRRYGALWAYDHEGGKINVSGPTQIYLWGRRWLEFHFCSQCACIVYWRGVRPAKDGRRSIGFNLRLAAPDAVKEIALVHHDTESMSDLPPDGLSVADVLY